MYTTGWKQSNSTQEGRKDFNVKFPGTLLSVNSLQEEMA
jgi:hypothetical protein